MDANLIVISEGQNVEGSNDEISQENDEISQEIMKIIKDNGLAHEHLAIEVTENDSDVDDIQNDAVFIESRKGKTIFQYNGYRYKKASDSKHGARWICSTENMCTAFLYLDDNDEITMIRDHHTHARPVHQTVKTDPTTDPNLHAITEGQYLEDSNDEIGQEEGNDEISQEIIKMIEEHGLTGEHLAIEVNENVSDVDDNDNIEDTAVFIESRKGKTILQYNGYRYRKAYDSKHGARWTCSTDKMCTAFLYLNDNDEMTMIHQQHTHAKPVRQTVETDPTTDTALVITSRKGKEMLLFRNYTYRKQYDKGDRARWVCSTLKNCRACVFTDTNNDITSVFEQHCHDPPKYYLKPNNVLDALRQPVIIETD